jgi:hypothetical protein
MLLQNDTKMCAILLTCAIETDSQHIRNKQHLYRPDSLLRGTKSTITLF